MSIAFNSGGEPLTVSEIDGTPNVTSVSKILVSNTTLTDDGGGEVTILTGGATSPGGSTTELQYNNAGSFDGASGLTTDGDSLTVTDDNYIKYGTSGEFQMRYNTTGGRFQISDSGGNVFLSITDSGTTAITNINEVDINSSGLTTKLGIKGDGATGSTYTIICEDSADVEKFSVADDGSVKINNAYTLPTAVTGTNDFVLTAQTDGTTAWASAGGGGASDLDGLTDVLTTSDNSIWIMNNGQGVAPATGVLSGATDNLAIGQHSGEAITSGIDNILVGLNAG